MSIVLNGSSQYAQRAAPVVGSAPFTVFAWYKSTSDTALQAIWGESVQTSTYDYWRLSLAGNLAGDYVRADIRHSETAASPVTSQGYSKDTWQSAILLETSSSDHKVYINGGYEGSSTVSQAPVNTNKMSIGALAYNSSWANLFAGKIAHVALWDIALTSGDRGRLAAGIVPSQIQPNHLVGYWPLLSNGNDYSGNDLHLTLVGSPSFDDEDVPTLLDTSYVNISSAKPAITALQSLPVQMSQHGFEECDGILYAVCGVATNGTHLKKLYAYDPDSNTWTEKADAPFACQSPVWRAVDHKLYLIGGYDSSIPQKYDYCYEYNPSSNSWTQKADMPIAREDHGSAVIDGKVYVFGGLTNPGHTLVAYIDVYDPSNNTWENPSRAWATPKALGDFAVAHDGKGYVISSTVDMGGYSDDVRANKKVYRYDTVANTFTEMADCDIGVCYKEIEDIEGFLYMLGGVTESVTNFTGDLQIYDVLKNSWRTIAEMIPSTGYMAACKYGSSVYFCGGSRSGASLDTLYRFTPGRTTDFSSGSGTLTAATTEEASIAGGFSGGGAIVLGVATPELASIAGGFTGGGSIMLLGSSAWAGQHDTKQYVVAIGNGQVWICEV